MLIRPRSPSVASRVAVTRQSAVSQRRSELLDHPEIGRYLAFRKGLPQFTDEPSQVVQVVFRRRGRQLHVLLEDRGVHRPVRHEAVQVRRGQNTGRCLPPPQRDPVHLRFEGDFDRDVALMAGSCTRGAPPRHSRPPISRDSGSSLPALPLSVSCICRRRRSLRSSR